MPTSSNQVLLGRLLLESAVRSSAGSNRLGATRPIGQVERALTLSDVWDALPWQAPDKS
jgi:hypothetical protein